MPAAVRADATNSIIVTTPGRVARALTRNWASHQQGLADYVTDDIPTLLGRPARTFEQFVTDHATAFSPHSVTVTPAVH